MDLGALARDAAIVVVAYLVGGIPWGIIVTRLARKPDPRTVGSGRTGGANVLRTAGPGWAVLSGILDVCKGVVVVVLARLAGAGTAPAVLAALAAILGHSRSPFIGLKGGRGVSVALGSLLVIEPVIALLAIPVYALVLWVSHYSSLASLTASTLAGAVLIVLTVIGHLSPPYIVFGLAGPALIWLFHADNVQRLLAGQERKLY